MQNVLPFYSGNHEGGTCFNGRPGAGRPRPAGLIRYAAEVLGIDLDPEKAIRSLIALMVLCCDPLAIALTAAASRA